MAKMGMMGAIALMAAIEQMGRPEKLGGRSPNIHDLMLAQVDFKPLEGRDAELFEQMKKELDEIKSENVSSVTLIVTYKSENDELCKDCGEIHPEGGKKMMRATIGDPQALLLALASQWEWARNTKQGRELGFADNKEVTLEEIFRNGL